MLCSRVFSWHCYTVDGLRSLQCLGRQEDGGGYPFIVHFLHVAVIGDLLTLLPNADDAPIDERRMKVPDLQGDVRPRDLPGTLAVQVSGRGIGFQRLNDPTRVRGICSSGEPPK